MVTDWSLLQVLGVSLGFIFMVLLGLAEVKGSGEEIIITETGSLINPTIT